MTYSYFGSSCLFRWGVSASFCFWISIWGSLCSNFKQEREKKFNYTCPAPLKLVGSLSWSSFNIFPWFLNEWRHKIIRERMREEMESRPRIRPACAIIWYLSSYCYVINLHFWSKFWISIKHLIMQLVTTKCLRIYGKTIKYIFRTFNKTIRYGFTIFLMHDFLSALLRSLCISFWAFFLLHLYPWSLLIRFSHIVCFKSPSFFFCPYSGNSCAVVSMV